MGREVRSLGQRRAPSLGDPVRPPALRHRGEDRRILQARHRLYQQARAARPARWSGATRDGSRPEVVWLNPAPGAGRRTAVAAGTPCRQPAPTTGPRWSGTGSRARRRPRRSEPLNPARSAYAPGAGQLRLPRLPHGECGAWGGAPRDPYPGGLVATKLNRRTTTLTNNASSNAHRRASHRRILPSPTSSSPFPCRNDDSQTKSIPVRTVWRINLSPNSRKKLCVTGCV